MRFVVVAGLLCALMVGLGYTYGQDSSVPAFLTAAVERGSISTLVKASGTVEAVVSVDVSSQLSGRIAEVFVNFNDTITAGQPISQIDQEIFAARVSEARAALRVARAHAPGEKGSLESGKGRVGNGRTARKLSDGQSGRQKAKSLFKIANDLREMEVHGKIDEADVGQLKVGQTAQFTVDAYPDRTFSGHVLQIRKSPEVVQNVVTYTTIVSAPNPDFLLLPGMTAQLRIVVSDTGGILKIPSQALRFRPNGAGPAPGRQNANQAPSSKASATIWLVGDDGRPEPVAGTLGARDDSSAALLEGGPS